jgi:hypothetical protein
MHGCSPTILTQRLSPSRLDTKARANSIVNTAAYSASRQCAMYGICVRQALRNSSQSPRFRYLSANFSPSNRSAASPGRNLLRLLLSQPRSLALRTIPGPGAIEALAAVTRALAVGTVSRAAAHVTLLAVLAADVRNRRHQWACRCTVRVFGPRPCSACCAIAGPSPCSTVLPPEPAHLPPSGTSVPCLRFRCFFSAARISDVFRFDVSSPVEVVFLGMP